MHLTLFTTLLGKTLNEAMRETASLRSGKLLYQLNHLVNSRD